MGSSGTRFQDTGIQLASDRSYVAWTQATGILAGGTVMPTAGLLMLRRIRRVPAASVTNVITYVAAGGSTLTAGQCFAGLWRSDGTLVGVTADQSTPWASSGLKTMALAGGPYSLTAGDYYVGAWFNGTTGPSLVRGGTINSALSNAGLNAPNFDAASANAGQTTTPPNPFGAQTAVVYEWWFALS